MGPLDHRYLENALPAFLSEAAEQTETFEQLMLALESTPGDRLLLDALFRCAHTVKGSAGLFGLQAVVAFTHHVETLLDQIREGERTLGPAMSTLLLESNDQIRVLLALPPGERPAGDALARQNQLVRRLQAASAGPAHAGIVAGVDLLSGADVDSPFDFTRDEWELRLAEASAAVGTPEAPSLPFPTRDDGRYLRVQAARLDAVIDLLGELVIASADAAHLARGSRQRKLIEANLQIGQLVEEVRNGTLQLRMVPIGDTFARFRRVVRDTASVQGKAVRLDLLGGDTELDKSIVERIADPLMHLVRNALDHGVESREERHAAGKSEEGLITLTAAHDAGGILISVSDDGRGVQRDKVLQRARERGLLAAGEPAADAELLNLVFEPGFSTAETVSALSGRGVGMDVVRRNIEALRGTVELRSEAGRGSRVDIRLPLTLAIIDGFLVGIGESRFVFPLETVVEVIENRPATTAPDSHGRHTLALRGQLLPVVDLRRLYALDEPLSEQSSVVVLRHGERRYGVVVDRLLGQQQTVIKPLGRLFRSLRGISGSSILGSGEVALIIDVAALGAVSASANATHHTPHFT